MNEEVWLPIPGYEGLYEVSNQGRVRSFVRHPEGRIMAASISHRGYYHLALWTDKRPRDKRVHRLVASAFVPNPDSLPEVNHKDGDKLNNRPGNLEWASSRENMRHAITSGRQTALTNPNKRYKLTPEIVAEIRAAYKPGVRGHGSTMLSRRYGLNNSTVLDILAGRSWYDPSLGIPPPQPRTKRKWRDTTRKGTPPRREEDSVQT